jgi:hypothetical protein
MRPQLLYKIHGLQDCDTLQEITRYLYSIGFDVSPRIIVERNFPNNINESHLPIIQFSNGIALSGLTNIIQFYEKYYNIQNLLQKSTSFINKNPNYKITDKSTHKNLKS